MPRKFIVRHRSKSKDEQGASAESLDTTHRADRTREPNGFLQRNMRPPSESQIRHRFKSNAITVLASGTAGFFRPMKPDRARERTAGKRYSPPIVGPHSRCLMVNLPLLNVFRPFRDRFIEFDQERFDSTLRAGRPRDSRSIRSIAGTVDVLIQWPLDSIEQMALHPALRKTAAAVFFGCASTTLRFLQECLSARGTAAEKRRKRDDLFCACGCLVRKPRLGRLTTGDRRQEGERRNDTNQ